MNLLHIKAGRISSCLLAILLLLGRSVLADNGAPPPNWAINPDDYEFSMNAVIRINYNGVEDNSAGNLVGAFVGGQLRGVASPVFFGGDAYYFLTVYSNQYFGETVRFKAYHAPDDAEYGVLEQVTFVHHLYLGTGELPFWININPNTDLPPVLEPPLADTTLQGLPFEVVDMTNYFLSLDGDPVVWSTQPGPNLTAVIVNNLLTVTPVSGTWTGTDSVRIIVTENTPGQLADTLVGWFTVLPDYGSPVWGDIPDQTIFQGDEFSDFDLDDYLNFNGDCYQYDVDVFPFVGAEPDPAWPPVAPGSNPMSIIARPLFADEPMAGAGARLAAFVNGNLAGWATPAGVLPNVTYSLQLANVGSGPITFRFYDAGNQYLYEETTTLNFAAGSTVGTFAAPYLLQLSPLVPEMAPVGEIHIEIDDPAWLGDYPVDFIVWDCNFPDVRRDTIRVVFSIVSDVRPEITSSESINFEENACTILYDTQSSDPNDSEGNGLIYSLAGGADVLRFSIDATTGILSWISGFNPNFENPQDDNADNKYQVDIRVTNSSNLSDTLPLTVIITNQFIEPFAATINDGAPVICTNVGATLTAMGGVSYVWSTGSLQTTIVVSVAGTYSVTATSTGACTAVASVVVAPRPTVTANGSSTPVCIGSPILLGASPSGGTQPYAAFSWTGPNGFDSDEEDPAGFPATPAAAGAYTVIVTDGAGCSASASTTIAVSSNEAPVVSASSNSPVCEGANIILNATPSGGSGGGYTYLWSGPNSYAASGQNPAPFSATLAAAGTYTVVLTDGAGCSGTATTSVQVNSRPALTAGNNSPVSVGANIILTSSTSGGSGSGYSYVWAGPNNYASTDAQPAPFTATPAANGTYTVTVTDSNGCTHTATTVVVVVACPTITANAASPICEGGTVLLSSQPSGGALPYNSFSWAGPNGFSATTEDPAGFVATMAANGTYTVTVTDLLGCTATATVSVMVNANPSISATNNGPVCELAQLTLSSTPAGGSGVYTTFHWNGPDFFGANVEDPAPFTVTTASAGIYSVTVTDNNGCTATAATNAVVHPRPTLSAASNSPLCVGAMLDLQSTPGSGTPLYTFNWAGPASFSSMLEDPTPFVVGLANAGTYTVTVTDNVGCSRTASTVVSVSGNNAPNITAASNSPLCSGAQLSLSSTPSAGTPPYVSFSWSGPNSYSSNLEDPNPFQVFLNGAGVYRVTVTDTKNCKGTASVTVIVNGPPANPSSNSPVCPNASILLSAGPPAAPGVTYAWSGPNGYSSTDREPAGFPAIPAAAGVYSVTITENGCSNSGTVTVAIGDAIPPVITCPANTTLAADANCSSPLGTWSPASLNDNCNANPTVTQSPSASTIVSGHNTVQTVVLTADDGNGNTASCSFTVTLKDVAPPVITCPANTTLAADANCSGTVGAWAPASLNDNCNANPTVTQSPVASTPLNGHNDAETVTLSADDGNGNTASCSFTVTLKDVAPPVITCPANTTLAADANCSGTLGAWSPASLNDNCNANPTITQSPVASTPLNGHNDAETVTLSADDGNGNTASCSFTVTLKDVAPPVITCPANTTLAADANCSGTVGAWAPASLNDNCNANPMVTQSPAASTPLNGHNDAETVTLSADDGNGNTASCSFTVTLKDVTPPVITCPANTTLAADANCSGTVGAWAPMSLNDNCNANPAVTQSPAASTPLNGHNDAETVTLTANDGNGNTASCSFTVTLKDVAPPVITCPANTTLAADANCSGTVGVWAPVTLNDNCNANPVVTQSPVASTPLNGHNDAETVTLTANDGNGNTASCSFTVTLKDVTPPTITCPANMTVAADVACSGTVGAHSPLSSGDNCNGTPTISQSPAANTLLNGHNDAETVTLTANDGNGNTASCSFTVTLKDVTPPTITCQVRVDITLNAAGQGSVQPAQALASGSDNCGVLNLVSITPNTFDCSFLDPGSVIGTLTANDGNGNTSTCTTILSIVDTLDPTMLCRPATIQLNSIGVATLNISDINNGSFDNCNLEELTISQTTFTCANLGPNNVTLTGRDFSDNSASCTAVVTVNDPIPPVALCRSAIIALGANGTVVLPAASVNNGSTDNCGFNLSVSPSVFNCSQIGLNTVVLTVTDLSGNTSTCTAAVTVRDVTPPTALCKNATIFLNNLGAATLTVAQVDNNSTDNCSIASRTLSRTNFDCTDITSAQNVTLTVKDPANNTSTCQAQVTVRDTIRPNAVCQNVTVQLGSGGTVTVYGSVLAQGSTDNCAVWSYTPAARVYTAANIGNNNLTITVRDWSGNTRQCTSVVTVLPNGPDEKPWEPIPADRNQLERNLPVIAYPNPSAGMLTVQFRLPMPQHFTWTVYDLHGRVLYNADGAGMEGDNTLSLDLSELSNGLYVLELRSEGLSNRLRFMIGD